MPSPPSGVTGQITPHRTVSPKPAPPTKFRHAESPVKSPTLCRAPAWKGQWWSATGPATTSMRRARLERPAVRRRAGRDRGRCAAGPGPRIAALVHRRRRHRRACSSRSTAVRRRARPSTPSPATGAASAGGHRATARSPATLHARGWALATMASLPHISVAGAVATGTHGSGDGTRSLAAAVAGLELIDGRPVSSRPVAPRRCRLRRVRRGARRARRDVTTLTLDVEPTYDVRQDVFTDLPGTRCRDPPRRGHGAARTPSASSPTGPSAAVAQVWCKSRGDGARRTDSCGARRRRPGRCTPCPRAPPPSACTQQGGVPGPWFDGCRTSAWSSRPSRGEELQSRVPRAAHRGRWTRVGALRALGDAARAAAPGRPRSARSPPTTCGSAARTAATPSAFHFTWVQDVAGRVRRAARPRGGAAAARRTPALGQVLQRDGGRPGPLYPRFGDFRALRDRLDPDRKFRNAFLDRVIG